MDELIKVKEAAALLRVTTRTVHTYLKDGLLKKIQPKRTIFLKKQDVLNLLKVIES